MLFQSKSKARHVSIKTKYNQNKRRYFFSRIKNFSKVKKKKEFLKGQVQIIQIIYSHSTYKKEDSARGGKRKTEIIIVFFQMPTTPKAYGGM